MSKTRIIVLLVVQRKLFAARKQSFVKDGVEEIV